MMYIIYVSIYTYYIYMYILYIYYAYMHIHINIYSIETGFLIFAKPIDNHLVSKQMDRLDGARNVMHQQ